LAELSAGNRSAPHLQEKKPDRSGAEAAPHIGMWYTCFIYPITATMPFLSNKGHSAEDVENMYQAWFKSITLQVTLCAPMPKMHISNLEVLMEFVGVFLVFTVSIKCCRAGDGITLLAALLVLSRHFR